ncbi:hypothetical protein ACA910_012776 [Epithemia clementina (nom. ined.)]
MGYKTPLESKGPLARSPGAWAGALIEAGPHGVFKMVSAEWWTKTKSHVETLTKWADQPKINRKALEQIIGFLVYVTQTYCLLTPYLKGLHLTLESWRADRDEDGWQMTATESALLCKDKGDDLSHLSAHDLDTIPQVQVCPVPRFVDDVRALATLTAMANLPRIQVRPAGASVAALMFGDASGAGFGSSLWVQGSTNIDTEHDTWTKAYSERSSNFREFKKLVS